jgi:hypothetical protein
MAAAFRLRGAARLTLVSAVVVWACLLGQSPSQAEVPGDVPTVLNQTISQALTTFADKAPNVSVVVTPPLVNADPTQAVVIDEVGTQDNFDGGTSEVTLTPGIAVPDLQHLTPQDADDALSAVDLTSNVVQGDPAATGVTVQTQDPAAGTIVELQTAVAISLSAVVAPSTPATQPATQPTQNPTSTDHPPWVWVLVGLVLVAMVVTTTSLWRRGRKRTRTEAAREQVLVRARGPAPASTRIEPLDNVPALSLWLDPHRDAGDQTMEEARQ